jgi:hypothetical protein
VVWRGGCVVEKGSREAEDEMDRDRDMLEVQISWHKEVFDKQEEEKSGIYEKEGGNEPLIH